MAARKTVKPGHVVESDVAPANENSTALDALQESEGPYEPGMAPLAKNDSPETSPDKPQVSTVDSEGAGPTDNTPEDTNAPRDDFGALGLVVLKNGATFRFRGQVFKKGEPTATEPEIAERLINSGMFDRG